MQTTECDINLPFIAVVWDPRTSPNGPWSTEFGRKVPELIENAWKVDECIAGSFFCGEHLLSRREGSPVNPNTNSLIRVNCRLRELYGKRNCVGSCK